MRLEPFLRQWLGAWPPGRDLDVVECPARAEPGWDGAVRPLVAVLTPDGGVVSVAPGDAAPVRAALAAGEDLTAASPRPLFEAVFRWSDDPAALEPLGEWRPVDDPALPKWMAPFGGDALVTLDGEGRYLAGVAFKRHHPLGVELSVGTEPEARGRGLARRLVATAARHVLDGGAVPLYLHESANTASAIVAEAAGFPDRRWRIVEAQLPAREERP